MVVQGRWKMKADALRPMSNEKVISWYDKLTWHDVERIARSKVKDDVSNQVSNQEVDFFLLGMEEVIKRINGTIRE
jgi:hypothetical protein